MVANVMYGELQKINKIIECFIPGDWGEESSLPNAENQYFCIRGADINAVNQGKFDKIPLRYTSFKSLQNKKLKKGDIVIEKSGGSPVQSTGRTCFISQELIESHLYVLCSNFCVAIRCKTDWNSKYVFYFLNYIYDQGVFFNFEGKTSGLKNLQIEAAFDSIKIPVIQRKKQDQIAYVLDAIEKRICNLRKQNSVMEQIAKNIYDYTFLQCAGHQTTYNKTLNRNIPADWEVKNIFDVFDIKYGFPFSTELFTEEITDKPVVRIRDILEHTTSAYTTEIVDEKYRLQEGDLVIGMDGNFHMNLWTDNISYLNQRCVRIRMNDNNVTSVQAKFALAPYIKAKEMTAKGSTVGHLSDKDLKGMYILVPDSKTLKNFNAQVLPIFQKQLVNNKQIEALTTQRNTLLPLLMTGQIEV